MLLTQTFLNQPHVPPSWNEAGAGLSHALDEGKVKREIMLLHRAITGFTSSRERTSLRDDLSAINSMCSKLDTSGNFANLYRVQCAGQSLWTTSSGVKNIQEACDRFDFERAVSIQADLESKLKAQEQLIKQLEAQVGQRTVASGRTNDEKKEAHS